MTGRDRVQHMTAVRQEPRYAVHRRMTAQPQPDGTLTGTQITAAEAAHKSAWWYRTVAIWVIAVFVMLGFELIFAEPGWIAAPSLLKFHKWLHIPWPAIGGFCLLTAAFIAWAKTRILGYLLAFIFAVSFAGIAITVSLFGGHVTNIIAVSLGILSPIGPAAGIRYAVLFQPLPAWITKLVGRLAERQDRRAPR